MYAMVKYKNNLGCRFQLAFYFSKIENGNCFFATKNFLSHSTKRSKGKKTKNAKLTIQRKEIAFSKRIHHFCLLQWLIGLGKCQGGTSVKEAERTIQLSRQHHPIFESTFTPTGTLSGSFHVSQKRATQPFCFTMSRKNRSKIFFITIYMVKWHQIL